MGLFAKKTPEEIQAINAEKKRKKEENEAQQVIFRDAYNKGRREALALEGEKKGKLSAQKSGSGLGSILGGLGNALGSERAQSIGANANNFILDGLDGSTRRKKHG